MTLLISYLFTSAIILLPTAHGFFGWYVNIQAGWCNDYMQQCASRVCDFLGFSFCSDSIRIQIHYDEITPHLCSICNKRCKRVPRDDGRFDDRLPCSSNLDCLMGQKCRDGGCWNWKQNKNCSSDWQCDRRQYSCQSFECRLRPVDGFGSLDYNNNNNNRRGSRRRCNNDWDRDCLPVVQGKSCTHNSNCDLDYICYNGQCILYDHKPKHCYDDRDCDNGFICRDRECVYGSRSTSSTSTTTRRRERMSCEDNSQCQSGERCLNLECVYGSRSTSTSTNTRRGERMSCEDNSQCPSGERCLNLECVYDNRRTTTIRTGGNSCDDNSNCLPGQKCKNFVCVNAASSRRQPKRRQESSRMSCEDSSQCRTGERCLNLECVSA